MIKNEWQITLETLNAASGQAMTRLTDADLRKVEALLDHWHRLARGELVARLEKAKVTDVTQ